jgi:Uma2 family endonuclease
MVAQSKAAQQEKLLSIEEFLEIAMRPENQDRRLELHDGVIVEKGEPVELENGEIIIVSRSENSLIAGIIITYLGIFNLPRKLGYISVPDGGYQVGGRKVYMPDVGFIRKERAGDIRKITTFAVAPDLAVEVISPSETAQAVRRKTNNYLKAGTRLVWNVYAQEQEIEVCTLTGTGNVQTKTLTVKDTLDGGDVLPGFTLELAELFSALTIDKNQGASEPEIPTQ